MREVNFSEVIKAVRTFDEASEVFLNSIEENFEEVPSSIHQKAQCMNLH